MAATYCTVPWLWHSDTAVMVAELASAAASVTCGARGETASQYGAAKRAYKTEARRASVSRNMVDRHGDGRKQVSRKRELEERNARGGSGTGHKYVMRYPQQRATEDKTRVGGCLS